MPSSAASRGTFKLEKIPAVPALAEWIIHGYTPETGNKPSLGKPEGNTGITKSIVYDRVMQRERNTRGYVEMFFFLLLVPR